MPQAVKIVRQTEEQGLAALRKQASARRTAREFTFGDGEDGFDQRAATVFLAGEIGAHLCSNTMNPPSLFPALGGDDAQGMKLLTNKGVIALGIELGVSQHAADGSEGVGLGDQSGQIGTIVPRGPTRRLCQDE